MTAGQPGPPGRPGPPDRRGPPRGPGPPDTAGPPGPDERDHGRQPERTYLAWWRTVLTALVAAVLAVRLALSPPSDVAHGLAAGAVLTGWLVLLATGWRRAHGLTAPVRPAGRAGALAALVTVGLAGIGLALVTA